jgi:hypothetical protein
LGVAAAMTQVPVPTAINLVNNIHKKLHDFCDRFEGNFPYLPQKSGRVATILIDYLKKNRNIREIVLFLQQQ